MAVNVEVSGYDEDGSPSEAYAAWLETLEEDVIQREFGYEPGEFTVFHSQWHGLYAEGLSPKEAWERALAAVRPSGVSADAR